MGLNNEEFKQTEIVTFVNENDFIKKYRGLKRYCPRAFKYLVFEIMDKHNYSPEIGKHEIELPTDSKFKMVYGQIKLIYLKTEKAIVLENIQPADILKDGYMYLLNTYRGVPYRNKKDKFKIDMAINLGGIANGNKRFR